MDRAAQQGAAACQEHPCGTVTLFISILQLPAVQLVAHRLTNQTHTPHRI